MFVFGALQDEIFKFREAEVIDGPPELSLRGKLRYVWNEDNMKGLLAQLRGIQTALSLLLQLLGTYVCLAVFKIGL